MNFDKEYPICGIYMIINQITGNRYIGQSNNILRRFAEHTCKSAIKKPEGGDLHSDIVKFGKDNFFVIILCECDEPELDEREEYFIRLLKPEYNKALGGKGCKGVPVTDERREKNRMGAKRQWQTMSDDKKRKILKNLKPRQVGFKLSDEAKEKIRQARIGTKRKKESIDKQKETMKKKATDGFVKDGSGHWKKVICVTTGDEFESVKSAAEHFGIDASRVSVVLKGKQKTTNNLVFIYGGK